MNVPHFVKVLIVVVGWIVGGLAFYSSWSHPVFQPDIVLSMMAATVSVTVYALAIFSTLLILGRIEI